LLAHGRKWGEHGGFPYGASATALGRLRPDEDAAEEFFRQLQEAQVQKLIDIRENRVGQLAGFAKRADLAFFLKEICGADYLHEPLLAPTRAMFDAYRRKATSWQEYEIQFLALMAERQIEHNLNRALFERPTVLLCSEPTAERCHRRLVLEYLREKWGDVTISHL